MNTHKLFLFISVAVLLIIGSTFSLFFFKKSTHTDEFVVSNQQTTSSKQMEIQQEKKSVELVSESLRNDNLMPSEEMAILDNDGKRTFYFKDSSRVWITAEMPPEPYLIPGADPKTFEPLKWPYSKDDKNVYFWEVPVESADVSTFRVVYASTDFAFGADKNHVFSGHKILVGADPSTFEFVDFDGTDYIYKAKDKNREYDLNVQMFTK